MESKDNKINRLTDFEVLKLMRKEKNVTQKELAKRLNVSQSAISQYESGQTELTIGQIMKICKALDQPFEDWLIITLGMHVKDSQNETVKNMFATQTNLSKINLKDYEVVSVTTLLDKVDTLNDLGKQKVIDFADDLNQIPKYKK